MADDITIPVTALGGTGIFSIVGGWLFKTHNAKIKELEEKNSEVARGAVVLAQKLSDYKLESEQRFAKSEDFNKSMERFHLRLDQTATKEDVQELTKRVNSLLEKSA